MNGRSIFANLCSFIISMRLLHILFDWIGVVTFSLNEKVFFLTNHTTVYLTSKYYELFTQRVTITIIFILNLPVLWRTISTIYTTPAIWRIAQAPDKSHHVLWAPTIIVVGWCADPFCNESDLGLKAKSLVTTSAQFQPLLRLKWHLRSKIHLASVSPNINLLTAPYFPVLCSKTSSIL